MSYHGTSPPVTDSDQVKAALAALAEGRESDTDGATAKDGATATATPTGAENDDYRRIIDRAAAATDDVELAAEFVESTGVERLREAVERAEQEVSGRATAGREALDAFERYRLAARAPPER